MAGILLTKETAMNIKFFYSIVLLALLASLTLACAPATSQTPSTVASVLSTPSMVDDPPSSYISFIINIHDWTHPTESADILLKLIDLLEEYGVRGDFYFTALIDGTENFWWNFMSKPDADAYNPTALLQTQLIEWNSHNYGREPFITSLIHKNNFYRSGAEAWSSIYFTMENDKKDEPLSPPWDLSAPDPSHLRTESDQSAIIAAYEELVAFAAPNLIVVTSEDILPLAQN